MADYSTPFARDAERRLANADEKQNGFPCGPANQRLFNGLMWQLWSELNAIHQAGGVTGDDSVVNTTLLNIQALIDAATGEGDTTGYLLLSQAVSRLPLFPEFLTSDGKVNVTSPASGTIRLPGSVNFMHRGVSPQSTIQQDFTTDPSKTYHLRWNPTNGFQLKDLTEPSYNPNTLPETDDSFDTGYDDMLVSRIITNSSNVSTITNLINKDRHRIEGVMSFDAANYTYQENFDPNDITNGIFIDLNMARKPLSFMSAVNDTDLNSGNENNYGVVVKDRYRMIGYYQNSSNANLLLKIKYGVIL
jgi:hypothetical protein